jgi:cytochrome c553
MKSMTKFFFAALTSTLMAGSVFAATAAPKAEKPDLAKGEAIVGGVCAACHMADGNSTTPVNPKLAQQHPEYTIKQLQARECCDDGFCVSVERC